MGFKCDECGSIWVGESLTKETLTFNFPGGDTTIYTKDLCPACFDNSVYPPQDDWVIEPPKRKRKKSDTIVHTTIPGLEVSV